MQPLKNWSLKRKITADLLGVALISMVSVATVVLSFQGTVVNRRAERHQRFTGSLLAEQVAAASGQTGRHPSRGMTGPPPRSK
jgi:hypothetical protein